jgi:hypothetical protein
MTITLSADQLVPLILGTASVVLALGYLGKKFGSFLRLMTAASAIVHRELTPNSSGSIKDDVDGLASSFGVMSRMLDDLDERVSHVENVLHDPLTGKIGR